MGFVAGCVLVGGWFAGCVSFFFFFTRRVGALDRELWRKLTTSGFYPDGGAPLGNLNFFLWLLKPPSKLRSDVTFQLIRFGFVAFVVVWVLFMRSVVRSWALH